MFKYEIHYEWSGSWLRDLGIGYLNFLIAFSNIPFQFKYKSEIFFPKKTLLFAQTIGGVQQVKVVCILIPTYNKNFESWIATLIPYSVIVSIQLEWNARNLKIWCAKWNCKRWWWALETENWIFQLFGNSIYFIFVVLSVNL